jgi:hypothetical protein
VRDGGELAIWKLLPDLTLLSEKSALDNCDVLCITAGKFGFETKCAHVRQSQGPAAAAGMLIRHARAFSLSPSLSLFPHALCLKSYRVSYSPI